MVADDLGDDEIQELLRKSRVELRLGREIAQAADLRQFPVRVSGRQLIPGLEHADPLGRFERSASKCTNAASKLSMLERTASNSCMTSGATWPDSELAAGSNSS